MTAKRGQHFTPDAVADALVEMALSQATRPVNRVLDPACGDGALLAAVRRRLPDAQLVGFDIDAEAASLARARLPGAKIVVADALRAAAGPFDAVVMNPPYVGEKGNRDLFDEVRALGPRWAERCTARMDYLYLFLHLGLDVLAAGGAMVALTTAYWPGATSASRLRDDLMERGSAPRFVRYDGRGLFGTAPGQHNLAVAVTRRDAAASGLGAVRPPTGGSRAAQGWSWSDARWTGTHVEHGSIHHLSGELPAGPWQPFVTQEDASWLDGLTWSTRVGDVARDRQGVVSGCDRQGDSPVFLLTAKEASDRGWIGAWFLEPLLRGSEVEPLVRAGAPHQPSTYLLYLDGSRVPPPSVMEHLAVARPRLERRRETQLGKRPWWALHWPRDRALMRRPKLVTARRAPRPTFYLDLEGLVVSSDCTWVVPDKIVPLKLQAALHEPEVARLLRLTGKWKGGLCEFYSEPLRTLRLPL
jgi:adenine-specific DNA-methyltransferase